MSTIPLPLFPTSLRYLLVFAVAGTIFYFSILAIPSPDPVAPTPTPATPSTPDFVTLSEWRHFIAYTTLGLTIAYALVTHELSIIQKVLLVVLVVATYGLLIELTQAFFTHRTFALRDVVINTLGGLASTVWYPLERRGRPVDVPAWVRHRLARRGG